MSLRGFHIVFITVTTLLCIFMAVWGFGLAPADAGVVAPGMEVARLPGGSGVTLLDLFDLVYDVDAPADELRRVLAAPIAERTRRSTEQRLARLAEYGN